MITLNISGFNNDEIVLNHLLLDFNGTLAIDGKLIDGVKDRLKKIAETLQVHVITGDSFGTANEELKGIPCKTVLLPQIDQCFEKGKYTIELKKETVIAIGNGRNDRLMLQSAAIGIVVMQEEGTAIETLAGADIVCKNIFDAFDLISNPLRLKATLRS